MKNFRIKNTLLFIVLILASAKVCRAQDYKFGDISEQELKETVCSLDSSAVAMYLFKHRKTYHTYSSNAGLRLITEVHERIKIYDEAGYEYGTKTINLYKNGSTNESVNKIKGFTYNLENGKVVSTELEKDGIFKSEYSKYQNKVKLALPNIKKGSVLEYKYQIVSPFYSNIDELVFQESIPVKKLDATIKIMDYFKYKQRHKGFLPIVPKKSRARISSLDTSADLYTFNMVNIPAIKSEKYVSNINNYKSAITFEVVSLEIPGRAYESFSKSWDDVVSTIYESSSFGGELKKKGYFEKELDLVLDGITQPQQRIEAVLQFVKDKVKWNTYFGYSTYEGVKKAFKEGVGNDADINLMLIRMLQHAKIKVHPVLVSTRDNGVPMFPTLQGYNYVVAAAKVGEEYHLLDATNPYSEINILPVRTLNWFGRMVSDNGNSTMVDLMPKKKSTERIFLNVTLHEDGSLLGKQRHIYTGHNAYIKRNEYNNGTQETYLDSLEIKNENIEISNFELKNNEDLGKPLIQSFELYKEDVVMATNDKLYFSPFFHLGEKTSPFKLNKREFPVEFGFAWQENYLINIKYPVGYKLESLPESRTVSLPENMGKFKYIIKDIGTGVSVSMEVSFNQPVIPAHQYDVLKEFYRLLIGKQAEKVVLTKI